MGDGFAGGGGTAGASSLRPKPPNKRPKNPCFGSSGIAATATAAAAGIAALTLLLGAYDEEKLVDGD